ncbi:hypothetical protein J5277_09400 [Rhizobium sp. 16-449-1b]|uniref:hypothetical protein n=1 Tax=Rhizobium sp. 16-449-1b TaxID=2819989 RepID=UPI001ADA3198|nr:hypothetical protein [Rhizobium sp. 16-449-1b]MBO9194319.1 hypothetical protein [Rhizobium sp. 16-449-1b]
MAENAATVWADGPPSQPYQPEKARIRAWGTWVEAMFNSGGIGGAVWKATKTLLNADLGHDADAIAIVHDDPVSANNGMYVKVGASGSGSWSQITTFLPGYQFITATDDGDSSANAYSMMTSPQLPYADGVALVEFVVPITNTSSSVTITFDDQAPLSIRTASGNSPAVGGLIAGMPVSGVKVGADFYMRSDQASAAVLTQMEQTLDSAVSDFTADTQVLRDQAQASATASAASATEAEAYAMMVGAAVYDFSFDSDPSTPGYDWSNS